MSGTATKQFSENVMSLVEVINEKEAEAIQLAAEWMCDSIVEDGIPHVFGTGHSSIPAEEVFIRAGTLSCVRAIGLDQNLGKYERIEGVAAVLMEEYPVYEDEVLFVVSNSGINPLPIEVAMIGNDRGAQTISVTSLEHSREVDSRHSNGLKLYQVTDLVIDTHVPAGDASIDLPQLDQHIGPISTIATTLIMQLVEVATIEKILERGHTPPIRRSRNLPGGDEHNRKFKEKYGSRIPEL